MSGDSHSSGSTLTYAEPPTVSSGIRGVLQRLKWLPVNSEVEAAQCDHFQLQSDV